MLTAEQIRAGRALLRMEQKELAERAGVSLPSIKRLEQMDGPLTATRVSTVEAIRVAMEKAGVQFIPENGGGPGVRLAKPSSRQFDTNEQQVVQYPEFKDGDGGPGSGG
ncbi:transcriptional regulator [Neorhizobium sp. P12A]|uniref:helix-turn-helix domain-containing protein n=1 Tax=Neorhizobium sp. P12A TaxID=2268027 RepID=UPI001FED9DC1|nr:transcriptional regulator [Neorhizobium sp. P12A]